jgi:hypothetical protein
MEPEKSRIWTFTTTDLSAMFYQPDENGKFGF